MKNRNGKISRTHTHTDHQSYDGSHHYVCGVKGKYSTYAYYDFGDILRSGTYEVYAYWPGYEESIENRNNGDGRFQVNVDGKAAHKWTEKQQYGGWERIDFGTWGLGKYYGRKARQRREIDAGRRLTITIHNGNNSKEGSCGPGPRIVFPPLLLMRIEDYPRHKPYSPAHDIYPPAAIDFVNCIHSTDGQVLSTDDKILRIITTIEALIYGMAGEMPGADSASTLVAIDNFRCWHSRVYTCQELNARNCNRYNIHNQWAKPISFPNNSVVPSNLALWAQYHQFMRYGTFGWWVDWQAVCFSSNAAWGAHYPEAVPLTPVTTLKLMPIGLEMDANGKNGPR